MIKIKTPSNRFFLLLMSVLLVISSLVPMMMSAERVEAAGEITIFLDMGFVNNGTNWNKSPSNVYYYLSSSTDASTNASTSLTFTSDKKLEATNYPSAFDASGKVFKLTFTPGSHTRISFSLSTGSVNGKMRTARRTDSTLDFRDKMRMYVTNDDWNGYQSIWVSSKDVDTTTDYAGQTFKLANVTGTRLPFKAVFTNGTDTYTVQNDSAYASASMASVGRNAASGYLEPVTITVPPAGANGAYTKVQFYQGSTMFKEYNLTLDDHKIIGKTFYYGWTEYQNSQYSVAADPITYGDYKTRCFYSTDYEKTAYPARSGGGATVLYFDKTGFPYTSASDSITVTTKAATYTTTQLTKGNASFVTDNAVELNEGEVFTITYVHGGVTDVYNCVWDSASSNMVVISTGKAQVLGTFSLQTLNEMPDGQKYITVKSNMYDYQYDQFNYSVDYQYYSGGWQISHVSSQPSRKGAAKRPYLAINEAISAYTKYSNGSGNAPLYIGQFWLPDFPSTDYGGLWDTSTEIYSTSTASKQRAGYNRYRKESAGDTSNDKYYIAGSQYGGNNYNDYYEFFGFGNTLNNFKWAANLAIRTDDQESGTHMPFDAVMQGLVKDQLVGGQLAAPNGTLIPYFDMTWWSGTFTTSQGVTINKTDYIDKYEDLDFPFFEIPANDIVFENGYDKDHMLTNDAEAYSGNYYVFDSKNYSVRASKTGGITNLSKSNKMYGTGDDSDMVYDAYGNGDSGNSAVGFFPFNDPADGGNARYLSNSNLHYGFGLEYDIEFYLNENGTVDGTPGGVPITFTFQGDDDVWVFLDDELILDMGGAHKHAIGEINFKNNKTFISAIGNISNTSIVSNNKTGRTTDDNVVKRSSSYTLKDFTAAVQSKATVGKHHLKMYYLERGMLNSNLYVMFNLPMALTKYELQVDTDFSAVNPNFLAATKAAADSDVFNFAVYNNGTTNVVGSGYTAPTTTSNTRAIGSDGSNTVGTSTILTDSSGGGTTYEEVVDSNNVYLDLRENTGIEDSSPTFAMYYYNDSVSPKIAKLKIFEKVTSSDSDKQHLYKVGYESGYTGAVIFRLPPGAYTEQSYSGSSNWNNMRAYLNSINGRLDQGKPDPWWGRTNDLYFTNFPAKNRLKLTGSTTPYSPAWYDAAESLTTLVAVTGGHTYNFKNDAAMVNGFVPLVSASGGVTYRLTDMYSTNSVTYDTRAYGTGSTQNIISMQFGEFATLDKQFNQGSSMKVVQLDTLSAPAVSSGNYTRASGYNDATGRTVSKYYNTYTVKTPAAASNNSDPNRRQYAGIYNGYDVSSIDADHINTMYGSVANNYSLNNDTVNIQTSTTAEGVQTVFNFMDPTNASNEYVYLRQVILNEVKTTALSISKNLTFEETDDTTEFVFIVTFDDVYGKDDGDSLLDVRNMSYMVYNQANLSGTPTTRTTETVLDEYSGSPLKTTCQVRCKAGQMIVISGIPIGTKYNVQEVDNNYYELDDTNSIHMAQDIELDENGNNAVYAVNERKTGLLDVVKLLYSQAGTEITDDTHKFTIVVTLTAPASVSFANYPVTASVDGIALTGSDITQTYDGTNTPNLLTLTLKVRSGYDYQVLLQGIPYGTNYSVAEDLTGDTGYLLRTAEHTGTVGYTNPIYEDPAQIVGNEAEGTSDMVTVENIVSAVIVMPETGGTPLVFLFPFGIIALAGSAAALIFYKRKLQWEAVKEKRRRD